MSNFEIFALIMIVAFVGIIFVYFSEDSRSITDKIERLSCSELQEYIFDLKRGYKYAEHRYEWMCTK